MTNMSQIKFCAPKFGGQINKTLYVTTHLQSQRLRQQTTATNDKIKEDPYDWDRALPFENIPGPSSLKMLRDYMPGGKYYKLGFDKTFQLMKKEYGNILYLPGLFGKPPIVATYDPKDFEIIFRNEGIWPNRIGLDTLSYHRLKHRADFFKGVEGLLTTNGEAWGNFRSKVNPALMQPKNVRLYLQRMSQVNKDFIELMKELRDPETHELPDNFENYINRWTFESVCVVALDKQFGLLNKKENDPKIQKLFDCITEFMILSAELDIKPSIWKIIPTADFKRIMKAYDDILEITSQYINEAIERLEDEKKNGLGKQENEKSVLEQLLQIDKKVAIVMTMDMLMAGVDTTSSAFTAIMLCLAKNAGKQAKLREEILRILPEKDSDFNEKSLNEMPYLRACIKESMRIYPLIVGNVRMVQRDVVVGGYKVPKNTMVFMMLEGITNNEKYYAQPNEFIPERWLRIPRESNTAAGVCPKDLKTNNPFTFLPFGFGPRMCIGRRIAEMELELGIARIIRNFYVNFNYPTENAFKCLLFRVPNVPLKFELKDVEF